MMDSNWKEMNDLEIMGDLIEECVDILNQEEPEEWDGFEAPELTDEDIENWYRISHYPQD
jgi:hypothetical protein